jgi:hypothetical protein
MQGWPLALTLDRANAFAGAICGIAGAVPADLASTGHGWPRGRGVRA